MNKMNMKKQNKRNLTQTDKRKRCKVCNKKLNRYNVNSYCRKHLSHGKSIEKARKGMIKIEDVNKIIDKKIKGCNRNIEIEDLIAVNLEELKQSLQELGDKLI